MLPFRYPAPVPVSGLAAVSSCILIHLRFAEAGGSQNQQMDDQVASREAEREWQSRLELLLPSTFLELYTKGMHTGSESLIEEPYKSNQNWLNVVWF